MLTSLGSADNLNRLKRFMGRFTGYTGVTNYMGAKFTSDVGAFGPVLAELKRRGTKTGSKRSTPLPASSVSRIRTGVDMVDPSYTLS